MALTFRGSTIALLGILDRDGGYRPPRDQTAIAQARTLVAAGVADGPVTTVVCNMTDCPSRLELVGDLTPQAAAVEATRLRWWTDGTQHVCPACKEGC